MSGRPSKDASVTLLIPKYPDDTGFAAQALVARYGHNAFQEAWTRVRQSQIAGDVRCSEAWRLVYWLILTQRGED